MGNAAIYSVVSSAGEEISGKVLVETQRFVLRSCIRSALGTWTFSWGKTTRNDLPEVPVLKWLRGGVLWVCFSGAIFGFHLVRCSSHVHSVLRSTSFNPAEFKPETTGRDVEKNF